MPNDGGLDLATTCVGTGRRIATVFERAAQGRVVPTGAPAQGQDTSQDASGQDASSDPQPAGAPSAGGDASSANQPAADASASGSGFETDAEREARRERARQDLSPLERLRRSREERAATGSERSASDYLGDR